MQNKERFYLIIGGAAILIFLLFSIFLFFRMREAREKEYPQEDIVIEEDASQSEKGAQETNDFELENEVDSVGSQEQDQAEREVNKDSIGWEKEKNDVESYIKSFHPSISGVTQEIEQQFLVDKEDSFLRELGIYLYGNYGEQTIDEVEFVYVVVHEDRTICVMKVTDTTGDFVYLMGIYYMQGKYYEISATADVYTVDDSEDMEEGGL